MIASLFGIWAHIRASGNRTHGTSPTHIVKSLIQDGIRRAIKEEWLEKGDGRKVRRRE